MNSSERIGRLSQVFARHRTFPISKYTPGTPRSVFQAQYPENYYPVEMTSFLSLHLYEPTQRGADLPWWGSRFFSNEPGCRVKVIARDSYYIDAGSIVFYAALFPLAQAELKYFEFVNRLVRPPEPFWFGSWKGVRDQLAAWRIELDTHHPIG